MQSFNPSSFNGGMHTLAEGGESGAVNTFTTSPTSSIFSESSVLTIMRSFFSGLLVAEGVLKEDIQTEFHMVKWVK